MDAGPHKIVLVGTKKHHKCLVLAETLPIYVTAVLSTEEELLKICR